MPARTERRYQKNSKRYVRAGYEKSIAGIQKKKSKDYKPRTKAKIAFNTLAEALSKGYLNPTANTASPFNTYTAVTANIDSLATKSTAIKMQLEDSH